MQLSKYYSILMNMSNYILRRSLTTNTTGLVFRPFFRGDGTRQLVSPVYFFSLYLMYACIILYGAFRVCNVCTVQ